MGVHRPQVQMIIVQWKISTPNDIRFLETARLGCCGG
jgi:hypothetical protein